jgi:hypothetical protein
MGVKVRQFLSMFVGVTGCMLSMVDFGIGAVNIAADMPQEIVRHYAIEAPLPRFPERLDGKNPQGVVVVSIVVKGTGGSISSVKVLEASDPSLVPVTESALARWRFRPFRAESTFSVSTRLVFYFTKEAGQPKVTDAAFEMLDRDINRQKKNSGGSRLPEK